MTNKLVSYTVNKDFENPQIFTKTSPEETGFLLTVAGRMHDLFLNEYKDNSEKITNAHKQGIEDTISKILEEAKKIEKNTTQNEVDELNGKVNSLTQELASYKSLVDCKNLELEYLKTSNNSPDALKIEAESIGYKKGFEECKNMFQMQSDDAKEKEKMLAQCQEKISMLQDSALKTEQEKNSIITKLKDENAKLNTPMGKGESGEYVVEETLKNAGFNVFDTSKSPFKEQGYMDRIITEDGNFPTSGWSIAIEVKNKKRVVKSTDIDSFVKKSEAGLKSGLFNGSIFFSIEDSLGKTNTEIIYGLDSSNIPIGPIGFYSPFTTSSVLTQEQLVLCVMQHVNIMKQVQEFRTMIVNNVAKDKDISLIQNFFKRYVKDTKENFEEYSEMTKTVQKMTSLLETKKKKLFEQFKHLESVNSNVSWLNANFSIPLNITYENAKRKYETNKNATKSQVFSKIGNVPILHNQLGLENAWSLIKTETSKINEEEFDENMFGHLEEKHGQEICQEDSSSCTSSTEKTSENSSVGSKDYQRYYDNNNMREPEQMFTMEEDFIELSKVSSQVVEHIKRKRSSKPDFDLTSVSTSSIAINLRDQVRQVGGLDIIKRFIIENKDKWPDMKEHLVESAPKTKRPKIN